MKNDAKFLHTNFQNTMKKSMLKQNLMSIILQRLIPRENQENLQSTFLFVDTAQTHRCTDEKNVSMGNQLPMALSGHKFQPMRGL